jgi:hypothetical protein
LRRAWLRCSTFSCARLSCARLAAHAVHALPLPSALALGSLTCRRRLRAAVLGSGRTLYRRMGGRSVCLPRGSLSWRGFRLLRLPLGGGPLGFFGGLGDAHRTHARQHDGSGKRCKDWFHRMNSFDIRVVSQFARR